MKVGSVLGALVALGVAFATAPANAEANPCVPSPAGTIVETFAVVRAAFLADVRRDPGNAVVSACRERELARSANESAQASIDLGQALSNDNRDIEAIDVLDTLLAREMEHGPSLRMQAYLRRANAYAVQRRMRDAAPDYAKAEALLPAAGERDSVLAVEVLLGRSSVLRWQFNPVDATRAADRAERLIDALALGQTRYAADVLKARAAIAYEGEDFAASIRYAQAQLDRLLAIGGPDDRELLDPLASLGAAKAVTGDYDGAETALREGLRIGDARSDASQDTRLAILQNLAALYLDRVQPAMALPVAQRALDEAIDHYGAEAVPVMREQLMIAGIEAELAHDTSARNAYAAAAKIDSVQGSAVPLTQRLRLALGKAQLDLKFGDRDTAREELGRLTRLIGGRPELAYWSGSQARLACKLAAADDDWPRADAQCGIAIERFTAARVADAALIFESRVGRCYAQSMGRIEGTACTVVVDAMREGNIGNPKLRVLAYQALAAYESRAGHADEALDLRVRTLAAAEEIASPDPLWAAEFALAADLASRGDLPLAIVYGKRAIDSIERLRSSPGADGQRLARGFLSNKLDVYRGVADWMLAEERVPEAVEVLQLLKREELYNFQNRSVTDLPTAIRTSARSSDGVKASVERIDGRIGLDLQPGSPRSAEIERLSRLMDSSTILPDDVARLRALRETSATDEARRSSDIRRRIAESAVSRIRLPPTAQPRRPESATEAIAQESRRSGGFGPQADAYFTVYPTYIRFILSWPGGEAIHRTIEVDARHLDAVIDRYTRALATRGDVTGNVDGAQLYAWLGAVIDREARVNGLQRVRLWLDRNLRYVPFAALWDGKSYLVERYEISYGISQSRRPETRASAATDAVAQRVVATPDMSSPSEGATLPAALVAFGVTQAIGGMPAIPAVASELCGIVYGPISGLLGDSAACAPGGQATGALVGQGFVNDFFTEDRFRTMTSKAAFGRVDGVPISHEDYVHVGTHFTLRPGLMKQSWLLLGDGKRLSLESLERMDLGGVDLMTLSACQTGMVGGTSEDGSEVQGLPALLHARGAKAVVASLWRVDDRGTSELMRNFYAALKKPGTRISDALREAQLAMLRDPTGQRVRPYFWAAFVPSAAMR